MIKTSNTAEYEKFSMKSYDSYFGGLKIGFFDIETTGLNRDKNELILSGIAVPEGNSLNAMQFLAENPGDEGPVLEETLKVFNNLDFVVTYNGESFDMPFLVERLKRNGIDVPKRLPYNLDIYRVLKFSPLKKVLPNMRQTTIENYLGLWKTRKDEISGKESISLYYHFASTGDKEAMDKVLLHNHDDICQLARIMPVLSRTDFDYAMFNLGYPAGEDTVTGIRLKHNAIECTGMQGKDPVDYRLYDDFNSGAYLKADSSSSSFNMTIPVISGDKHTVADLRMLGIDSSGFTQVTDDFVLLKQNDSLLYGNINGVIKEMLSILMDKARAN